MGDARCLRALSWTARPALPSRYSKIRATLREPYVQSGNVCRADSDAASAKQELPCHGKNRTPHSSACIVAVENEQGLALNRDVMVLRNEGASVRISSASSGCGDLAR